MFGKKYGCRIIVNPAPFRKLKQSILSNIDILIPNRLELEMLAGRKLKGDGDLIAASNLLLKGGVECVIITLGNRGAFFVSKNKRKLFDVEKVRDAVDTTCAGDAFCGALAFSLDRGSELEHSIRFANRVAVLTVTKLGAQSSLPALKEVRKNFL